MEQIMIYELRIYRCVPGRQSGLLSRFKNETLRIWEKHGIRQTPAGSAGVTRAECNLAWRVRPAFVAFPCAQGRQASQRRRA
jgi:hypothetical protein